MKTLITGGSGLLGKYLFDTAIDPLKVLRTYRSNLPKGVGGNFKRLDILNKKEVEEVINTYRPTHIIHTAAIGSVDFAEYNFSMAHRSIVEGTNNVIIEANKIGAMFVYVSSNAVYDGNRPKYSESSTTDPINNYGKLKNCAEQLVMNTAKDWLIIRPILLYGWSYPNGRENWVTTIIERLRNDGNLNIVCDTVTQPTYAKDCADIIWKFILMDEHNISVNVGSVECMSLYNFATLVCEHFNLDYTRIKPVTSASLPNIAKRPVDTTYTLDRLRTHNLLQCMSTVCGGLRDMRSEEK